jgi:hypothetical protein
MLVPRKVLATPLFTTARASWTWATAWQKHRFCFSSTARFVPQFSGHQIRCCAVSKAQHLSPSIFNAVSTSGVISRYLRPNPCEKIGPFSGSDGRRGMVKKSRHSHVTQRASPSASTAEDVLEHGVEKVIFSHLAPNQFRMLSGLCGVQLGFWLW